MKDLTQQSKQLSYLLRHSPEKAGLSLDKEGWCEVEVLLANTDISRATLEEIVGADSKQRYSFSSDGKKIRANQGHSTKGVALTFKQAAPPVILYHGTPKANVPLILKLGLKPMRRHHVHLSADINVAEAVGSRRRGEVAIFKVDAKSMLADAAKFYISENGVWLVDAVAPKYLSLDNE